MRRILLISGVAGAAIVAVAASLIAYAFFNLSSIVDRSQARIVARVSEALGRPVNFTTIQAHMGWGVSVNIAGLKVADDSAFSEKPFLTANDVALDVEFLPLLRGEAKVIKLELIQPDIRIVMNANGDLNVDSIGSKPGESEQASGGHGGHRRKKSAIGDLSIKALSIEDGTVYFNDLSEKATPVRLHHVDFDVTDFNAASAFDVALKFALAGDTQNITASGKLGPLLQNRVIDASGIPIDIAIKLDSIALDSLRPLADIGSNIPPALSIPDAATVSGTASGTFGNLALSASTDLTANRVAYGTIFSKPAGTAMTVNANATYGNQFQIASVDLKLNDLDLTASRFSGGGPQPLSLQLDSNSFDLAKLIPTIAAAAGYDVGGQSEVHGTIKVGTGPPAIDGTVALKQAAVKGPSWPGGLSDLTGTIKLANGTEVIEPTTFTYGATHAKLEGRIESIDPLRASYTVNADKVRLSQIVASRSPSEFLSGLAIKGTADGALASPRISASIRSSDGNLQNVAYDNLSVNAAYFEGRVSARELSAGVFGGSIGADGDASFGAAPGFNLQLSMRNLNIEQGLRSQNLDAAKTVHGSLTGNVAVSGSGSNWNRIRPTLRGSGRLAIANGQLVGVNIVADAINAVAAAPGVSQIMNVAFMSSHHGVLVDPNTELQTASMSYEEEGPRFTTHDLFAQSPDYAISGDGWFDMDKKIDMTSDIRLALGLQVAIPVYVTGTLPHVIVLPNVPTLAGRIAMGAINTPGNILRSGVNAVGSVVGAPQAGSSLPHPIDAIKKWIP